MRKRRQVEAFNGEFQLPEPILHHVQSFLTAKEAARTAILSKSWRRAWSTRPNLELDLDNVGNTNFDELSELAKKIIQRYEESNLKIESLRLCIEEIPDFDVDVDTKGLANDLITRALKIGATHLSLEFSSLVIFPRVVFEAENLVELSVEWCPISDLVFGQKVRCSKLESLSLRSVNIDSEMICNIASYCPLILKLSLCDVYWFNNDDHVYSFLGDLSSIFPSLKDLTLDGCETHKVSRVSSRSLEQLNFVTDDFRPSVKFDVPSICKFRFEGVDIPSLSFVSAPREWESDILIKDSDIGRSTLWFLRLNKFLTESSLSIIYLSLESSSKMESEYEVGDIRGLPKPILENLTIKVIYPQALRCFALFHGLFQICRPKFITLDYEMKVSGTPGKDGLLRKTLARGLDDKCIYGLNDLEEVNVHVFDKDVNAWRPLPLESFLDPSMSPKVNQKTRFQLKWKT